MKKRPLVLQKFTNADEKRFTCSFNLEPVWFLFGSLRRHYNQETETRAKDQDEIDKDEKGGGPDKDDKDKGKDDKEDDKGKEEDKGKGEDDKDAPKEEQMDAPENNQEGPREVRLAA